MKLAGTRLPPRKNRRRVLWMWNACAASTKCLCARTALIFRAILGESITVEQFAEKMATDEGGRRLRETLRRVRDFVGSCEGVEAQPASKTPSDTTAEPR
ncbi:MAG TPA: hypothetical protein VN688_20195 [Gemmataceae bacterium]|nr:hypothetical protein [Gemmataceae bacterium]